jgi:hypothetical protein
LLLKFVPHHLWQPEQRESDPLHGNPAAVELRLRDQDCAPSAACARYGAASVVGLDLKVDHTDDGRGWIEIVDKGMLVTLRGKTG